MRKFPFYVQLDRMDCGPTCLRMVAKHYGKQVNIQLLREQCGASRSGVSLLTISRAAEMLGFRTRGLLLSFEDLATKALLPCVAHWDKEHFVVVVRIKGDRVQVADPAKGLTTYSRQEFCQYWCSTQVEGEARGAALLLEPTAKFEEVQESATEVKSRQYFALLLPYRRLIGQLCLGLAVGSVLQLLFPFLTKSVVDVGIRQANLGFVYLVLTAQLMLFLGRISIEFIQSWILLYISSRVSVTILSDFLLKLMRLPLSFFDVKMFGDIMQRMNDQRRIETFLTSTSLASVFSLFSLLIFSSVLLYFNFRIFLVFAAASLLYVGWISLYMKSRRVLDFRRFDLQKKEQSAMVELVNGMQDIKIANAELQKRWRWEGLRARLFQLTSRGLSLTQYQEAGGHIINEGKNIFVTFLSAKAVINGSMSLGSMLAIQYIIGQLNGPVNQLITFVQAFQDAKISMERLNDVHSIPSEESDDKPRYNQLPERRDITLRDLSFAYPGTGGQPVLANISFDICQGGTTAIVGMSGSGKTTLLKMLLNFYPPYTGEIRVGGTNLQNISNRRWRDACGVVMQDGFIFSDTIAQNIAVGIDNIDMGRLLHAARVANLEAYVESLPLGFNTRIGAEGNGLSQGQKQRILIARVVYKDPEFIFFDEATNALDANNEAVIMHNIKHFFKGKTVLMVAHRLSTVRNADHIIVLHQGCIAESGTHEELVMNAGPYFELVRNQLELSV